MTAPRSPNVHWHAGHVTRTEREALRGHRGVALWLTGLSGSGKSTLARVLEQELTARGCAAYVLDGDNLRHGLCSDLEFTPEDRTENVRRVGEVAKLFVDAGVIVLCAFVSPYQKDREAVRALMAQGDFLEVHVEASLEACRARDPKGLYQKAADGQIADMTGLSAPYEPPQSPEISVNTEHMGPADSLRVVVAFLEARGYIPDTGTTGMLGSHAEKQ
jgi:adenylylsulfate kinase